MLRRYVEYISNRVAGLGGDPGAIPPSPVGAPVDLSEPCADLARSGGKIVEVIFDCFGDFEGFVLDDCCRRHTFRSREREIGELAIRLCRERLSLSVFVNRNSRSRIHRLVIRA